MKKRDLKVGMRVRVKSWEDMKKGVGVSVEDDEMFFPYYKCSFTSEMKHLCGRIATVITIGDFIKLSFEDKSGDTDWYFVPRMLEQVEEEGKISGVTINGEHIGEEKPKNQSFTKKDLKFGNVVELRNGSLCLIEPEFNLLLEHKDNSVTNPALSTRLRNIKTSVWETNLDKYNNNLKNNSYDKSDIMKVYEDYTLKNLLWERKEIKLSEREIEVLKALKTLGYRTLIRNEDNQYVHACNGKDYIEKSYCFWKGLGRIYNLCDETLFKFVKWEDEKPYSIEELLENESN